MDKLVSFLYNDNQKEYDPKNLEFILKEIVKEIPIFGHLIDYIEELDQRKKNEFEVILYNKVIELGINLEKLIEEIKCNKNVQHIFDFLTIKSRVCTRSRQLELMIYIFCYYINHPNQIDDEIELMIDIISELNSSEESFFLKIIEKNDFNLESDYCIDLPNLLIDEEMETYVGLKNRLESKGIWYGKSTLIKNNIVFSGAECSIFFTKYGKLLALIIKEYQVLKLTQ